MPPPPLLECVPNVSEGRDLGLIEALTAAITSVPGTRLLHRDIGRDANRTVFTFVGEAGAVRLSAKRLARACVERIDLRAYSGTHPYVGALDVCPFVPLWGLDPVLAKAAATDVGHHIATDLGVPVYFYEHSARRERFRSLAAVRKGGLAAVAARLPTDAPDLGGRRPHPTAGVAVVGARELLIAFNINLATRDATVARAIARELRRLPHLRAIGWYQEAFGCAQVSCNLLDYRVTGLGAAFAKTRQLARARGTDTAGSEPIGLLPEAALVDAGRVLAKAHLDDAEAIAASEELLGLSSVRPFVAEERVLEWVVGGMSAGAPLS